jgi:lysozyme
MSIEGIDVSHFQGPVKWLEVVAGGITFAYAKASQGQSFRDPAFPANWSGMKAGGVRRGAYHFFRPAVPVAAQLDTFKATVGTLDAADLPPMLDIEEAAKSGGGDEWDDRAADSRTPLILQALAGLEQRFGRRPIIYVRSGFIATKVPDAAPLGAYPLWVAHYTTAPAPALPTPWTRWTLWQYIDKGQVAGVTGPVDRDRFNGTLADLDQLGTPTGS